MFYNSPASQVVLPPSLTIPRRKLSDGLALKQEWHHISSFQSSSKKMEMQLRVWNASCEVFGLIKLKTVVVTYAEKTSSATHDGEKFGLNHIKQPWLSELVVSWWNLLSLLLQCKCKISIIGWDHDGSKWTRHTDWVWPANFEQKAFWEWLDWKVGSGEVAFDLPSPCKMGACSHALARRQTRKRYICKR